METTAIPVLANKAIALHEFNYASREDFLNAVTDLAGTNYLECTNGTKPIYNNEYIYLEASGFVLEYNFFTEQYALYQ